MLLKHGLIRLGLIHLQVREEFSALCDLAEQTAAGCVILLVLLEVLRQEIDLIREEGDLHVRRSGVLGVHAVLLDQFLLVFALEHKKGSEGQEQPASRPGSVVGRLPERGQGTILRTE